MREICSSFLVFLCLRYNELKIFFLFSFPFFLSLSYFLQFIFSFLTSVLSYNFFFLPIPSSLLLLIPAFTPSLLHLYPFPIFPTPHLYSLLPSPVHMFRIGDCPGRERQPTSVQCAPASPHPARGRPAWHPRRHCPRH